MEFALKILDLFGITVAASAGLCGAALAFSPGAAAVPPRAGAPTCMEQVASLGAPLVPAVLPGPPVVAGAPAGAVPAGAPVPAGLAGGGPRAGGGPAAGRVSGA